MDNKKIAFISCVSDEKMYQECLLYISHLEIPEGYQVECIAVRDAFSMAEGYNAAMHATDAKYKVYLHQDVFILNRRFLSDTLRIFQLDEQIGLMGVIGGKILSPSGIWWNFVNIYGAVYDNRKIMSKLENHSIEQEYEEVQAIDGLILITQQDFPFRADLFDGWYYYDISQCMEFQNRGYHVVVPHQDKPWCLHDCGSGSNQSDIERYRRIFLTEYSKSLSSWKDKDSNFTIKNQDDILFTGERLVVNQSTMQNNMNIVQEHVERYKFASAYVKGKRVLDAACGAGYGTKLLANCGAQHVVGIDVSRETIAKAAVDYGGDNISFEYGDVTHLKYNDESFDVVVSFETIEHIKDGLEWIMESNRLLKEKGIFIVSTPNRDISGPGTYQEEHPLNPFHQYEYNFQEFVGALLTHYDILKIYGQTFFKNNDMISNKIIRACLKKI